MMDIVKSSDLRKETGECFIVVFPKVDCPSPVITPLNHSSYQKNNHKFTCLFSINKYTGFKSVTSNLVNIFRFSQKDLWPIAESQKIL